MILSTIKKRALNLAKEFKIVDFSFALPYTYVLVERENKRTLGVAMTLPEEIQRYTISIEEPTVEEFIAHLDSLNMIERTLGLAAVNAVSQHLINLENAVWDDALSVLKNLKKIAVIGNMPPLVKELREKNIETYVFERNSRLWTTDTLSDALEYSLLPEVDAVLASASCLINGSFDMINDRASNAKIFMLIGATAQLLPELLETTRVTHLSSIRVKDIDRAVKYLKLGSFQGFSKVSDKYILNTRV